MAQPDLVVDFDLLTIPGFQGAVDDRRMYIARQEVLPPSGVEFAVSLHLTPSTASAKNTPRDEFVSRVLTNLVVARSNLLRIFEVWQEPVPIQADHERERHAQVRKGTEAVEGEVEMDTGGEGFINVGQVKVICTYVSRRVPLG